MILSAITLTVRGVKQIPTAIRFLRRFVQLAFLYTNHDRRISSLFFAAIGSSVGFFVGYAPIVALVGAALGVLEFELTKSLRERMSNQLHATTES